MLILQQARAEPVELKGLFSVRTRKFVQMKVTKSNLRWDKTPEDDDNGCLCAECVEPYSVSRALMKLFHCTECHNLARDRCAGFGSCYVCRNYSTDDFVCEWWSNASGCRHWRHLSYFSQVLSYDRLFIYTVDLEYYNNSEDNSDVVTESC